MKSFFSKMALFSCLAFGALSVGAVSNAYAGTWCGSYTVSSVALQNDGTLFVSLSGFANMVAVCSVNASVGGWSSTTCRQTQVELTSAMLAGRKATLVFDSAKKGDCSAPGDWTHLSATYGLYFVQIL